MEKTNVSRLLDVENINYEMKEYDKNIVDGLSVAKTLNENDEQVFKTLVTISNNKEYFVFVVPVNKTLDLKKASKATNSKSIEMIPQKQLLPLTGYIHGGCSPIGMKKKFETIIDETAQIFDYIYVSAGKIGYQIKINPNDLIRFINGKYFDICK